MTVVVERVTSSYGNGAITAYNDMSVAVLAICTGNQNNNVTVVIERVANNDNANPIVTLCMCQMKC